MRPNPPPADRTKAATRRLRLDVTGAVQGVGFRPFVHRLARETGLGGWVENNPAGVAIEVEGAPEQLAAFRSRLETELPPRASIRGLSSAEIPPAGEAQFAIRDSPDAGPRRAPILPDLAVCDDCRDEVNTPGNRRYRYPFTNCTNCGPRYSILERLPYDRANTTMRRFHLCAECRREYEDPNDRRFHAQPNACPACGPRLEWWDGSGGLPRRDDEALRAAAASICAGRIVAVKGLGGFLLLAAAGDRRAVLRLRERKHREAKPFALLVRDLAEARRLCFVSPVEQGLLTSPEAPIVLLRRRDGLDAVAAEVAPGNPYLGVMLPYTPLHALIVDATGMPVVATSGNRAEEPICTDEHEARERLGGIADDFLVHDRPIARPLDDSVVREAAGRELVLRRARGYAPWPVSLGRGTATILAVGAHQKNTVAVCVQGEAYVSQHIGDLDTVPAERAFRAAVHALEGIYATAPDRVACDLHPDYRSTAYARERSAAPIAVQHHHAHVASCMVENGLDGEVLGVAWDGTGYGPDGTVWGGEFLAASIGRYRRVAHLRTFGLPGGERAVREPRRAALGVLYALLGDAAFARTDLPPVRDFTPAELAVLRTLISRGAHCPTTSSAGRLFDAVAALMGLVQVNRFEGEAGMALEFRCDERTGEDAYPFPLRDGDPAVDWGPALTALLADLARGTPNSVIAMRFHHGLVETIPAVARRAGLERVVLTGGCFQNRVLLERAVRRLGEEGLQAFWHRRVPPNDGGIALGQAAVAAALETAD